MSYVALAEAHLCHQIQSGAAETRSESTGCGELFAGPAEGSFPWCCLIPVHTMRCCLHSPGLQYGGHQGPLWLCHLKLCPPRSFVVHGGPVVWHLVLQKWNFDDELSALDFTF